VTRASQTLLAAALVGLLTACGPGASPETACLDAERIKFNDPASVKAVKNLGKRWGADDGEHFWLRYTATNVMGGTVSSNMACSKDASGGSKWARDAVREHRASVALEAWAVANYKDVTFARSWSKEMVYDQVKAFPEDLRPASPLKSAGPQSADAMRPR